MNLVCRSRSLGQWRHETTSLRVFSELRMEEGWKNVMLSSYWAGTVETAWLLVWRGLKAMVKK